MLLLDQSVPGGKLEGLIQIPVPWVPPFFSISSELHRRFLSEAKLGLPVMRDLLTPNESERIEEKMTSFGPSPENTSLIVRSDAIGEGLAERGMLKSFGCDGSLEGILTAAERVFQSFPDTAAISPIGLIVQLFCAPALFGHLSNERRVAEEIRRWTCEMTSPHPMAERSLPETLVFRVERSKPAGSGELRCATVADLLQQLHAVGRYFYDKKQRRHIEWIWDRERLLIVQNDAAPDPVGESPEFPVRARSHPLTAARLRVFRPFRAMDGKRWQKLNCVNAFKEIGLPTTPLFVLKGENLIRRLSKNQPIKHLLADLQTLTRDPLVIRTDLAHKIALYAPRTDGVKSARAALGFLRQSSRNLIAQHVKPSAIGFISHRFIPAAASAFSLARPTSSRVRIDALWGLPDGLEFCPHDSFEVDSRTGSILAKRIRYKPNFLAALPSGNWKVTDLGIQWDWKPSVDDDTLAQIAAASWKLARKLRTNVVIMWFARVSNDAGHPSLIPWRYTTENAPRQVDSAVGIHFQARPFPIKNTSDIERLRTEQSPISSVILRPDGPHLRDEAFLSRLGDVVRERALRIDLEGSPLSHAYYVLKRTGAHVACVDPINPKAVRHRFEKLVRDRIPVYIRGQGEHVETVNLPDSELIDVLKAKIVEEALEVLSARPGEALQEELADVLEVLRALCQATRKSMGNLERIAAKKRKRVGGFRKGIVLVETEETPLIDVRSDSKLFGRRASKSSLALKSVIAAGRRPKTQRDRLVIPLVPPAPSRFRGASAIQFRQLGLTFRVFYKEKSVEVVIEKYVAPMNSAQLLLPFE
jgi:predicted house-cleaning noncanonical NTP pyrophosphatase (MazG superfamily)